MSILAPLLIRPLLAATPLWKMNLQTYNTRNGLVLSKHLVSDMCQTPPLKLFIIETLISYAIYFVLLFAWYCLNFPSWEYQRVPMSQLF